MIFFKKIKKENLTENDVHKQNIFVESITATRQKLIFYRIIN